MTIDGQGRLHEALEDDELARSVLALIRNGGELPSGSGVLRGERLPGAEALWGSLPASPPVRALTVEQSNTSVVFGESVILKMIRKLELGVNPELELGRFLARKGFRHAPALLGALTLSGVADSTIAVAHQFVKSEGDGWSWVLEQFRKSDQPTPEVLSEIRKLGARVGDLHQVLASEQEDPAFRPEPIQTEDLQRWSSSIIGELGVTLADAIKHVPELADCRTPLTEHSGMKTRVHGDLHLAQVLRADGDWMIFDFEGEPARSFEQRREKHSPLKDVAGLLRSFSYAEAAVELEGCRPANRAKAAREAFLNGYWSATSTALFLPSDGDRLRGYLDALELEKILYELRYEVSRRPDWVKIPARALLERAAQERS